jgi:hypothetical protein
MREDAVAVCAWQLPCIYTEVVASEIVSTVTNMSIQREEILAGLNPRWISTSSSHSATCQSSITVE